MFCYADMCPVWTLTTRTRTIIRSSTAHNREIKPAVDSTHIDSSFHSEITAFAPRSAPTILYYPIISSILCTPANNKNRVINRSRATRITIDAWGICTWRQVCSVQHAYDYSMLKDSAHYLIVRIGFGCGDLCAVWISRCIRVSVTAKIGDFISIYKRTVIASPDLFKNNFL
jgi:hypothetical protein